MLKLVNRYYNTINKYHTLHINAQYKTAHIKQSYINI